MRLSAPVILVLCTAAASGCATNPAVQPTRYYVSWSGRDPRTAPVAEAIGAGLRREPGFVREFEQTMQVFVGDGLRAPDGNLRFEVQMRLSGLLAGRRISPSRRRLAEFSVLCTPEAPEPCADAVLRIARLQPRAIRRLLATAPPA